MTRKYFGTDGVRGKVGEYPITPEFALKLGWAAGKVLAKQGSKKILIGKDTRISGYLLESALESGLSAAGLDAYLMGPMPTPAVAYLTRTFRADAGIVISASHNPYYDNGIKFFSADGSKLPDAVEQEIEDYMDQPLTCVSSELLGKAARIEDAAGRYIEYCKSTFPSHLSLAGLKIVLDCAHGATYHVAPPVFQELGAEVITIGDKPNGLNINEKCGATDVKLLQETVLAEKADIGIALDGDGDRIMIVDRDGSAVDGDEILYILASDAQRKGRLRGGVVGTLMANMGLEVALSDRGIAFSRSNVGDRYVIERLKQMDWRIGGENSGHIISLDHSTTGDGIVAGLQVLTAMQGSNLSLAELRSGMTLFPQVLVNVRFKGESDPLQTHEVKDAVAQVEAKLGRHGRVLLRKSGTEPLIRVMVEGRNEDSVIAYAESIADVVRQFS